MSFASGGTSSTTSYFCQEAVPLIGRSYILSKATALDNYEEEIVAEAIVHKVTHQTLAEMVGTTRPRITLFMTRFKNLGLIEYRNGELYFKRSLLDHVNRGRSETADRRPS